MRIPFWRDVATSLAVTALRRSIRIRERGDRRAGRVPGAARKLGSAEPVVGHHFRPDPRSGSRRPADHRAVRGGGNGSIPARRAVRGAVLRLCEPDRGGLSRGRSGDVHHQAKPAGRQLPPGEDLRPGRPRNLPAPLSPGRPNLHGCLPLRRALPDADRPARVLRPAAHLASLLDRGVERRGGGLAPGACTPAGPGRPEDHGDRPDPDVPAPRTPRHGRRGHGRGRPDGVHRNGCLRGQRRVQLLGIRQVGRGRALRASCRAGRWISRR